MTSQSPHSQQLQILQIEHSRITDCLHHLLDLLEQEYQLALQYLKMRQPYGPKYSVNLGLVHSVITGVEGMVKFVDILRGTYSGREERASAYLMEEQPAVTSAKPAQQQPQLTEQQFIKAHKYSSQLSLSKHQLSPHLLQPLSSSCKSLYTLHLHSDHYDQKNQIEDHDLQKLTLFSNISVISLKESAITDTGIQMLRDSMASVKQVDLTGCYMLTDRGVRLLAECDLVTIKLNSLSSLKEETVLQLIRHATNLNYLQLRDCPLLTESLFFQIYQIYRECSSTLKWLQITSSYGIDLFVNKLMYMTSENPVEEITDTEFNTLIGQSPPAYTGLYFENCQELTKGSVDLIVGKLRGLRRLALAKFVNLTDRLVQDISLALAELVFLDFNCCYNITDNALYYVAHNLQIEYLILQKCYSITDQGLLYILDPQDPVSPPKKYRSLGKEKPKHSSPYKPYQLQSLTHIESTSSYPHLEPGTIKLKHLNIAHCKKITDSALSLLSQNARALKFLNMANCDQISDVSIEAISEYLLNLEYLNLNHCDGLTDSSISMLATRLGKKLRVLEIEWCAISQNCVRLIAENLTNLRVLNLSYCPAVHSEQIQILAKNIPKIHTIKLQSCSKISEQAFIRLASLRQLKIICLKQCVEASDTFIKLLTTNNRYLEQLDISWCTQVTDNSLFSIAKNCYALRYLNLNGCVQISDQGIEWLSATVSQIQYLNLTLCSKLTDISILHITSKLPHLKTLYLCELSSLTDTSIASISNLHKLEQLVLLGCTGITNSSLIGLLYNLEKLWEFNITRCRAVDGRGLGKICQFLGNCKILEISQLRVDDRFLEELCKYCTKLTFINLCYCNDISDAAVLRMLQRLPRLQKIDIQNTNITQRTQQMLVHALNARRMDNIVLE